MPNASFWVSLLGLESSLKLGPWSTGGEVGQLPEGVELQKGLAKANPGKLQKFAVLTGPRLT